MVLELLQRFIVYFSKLFTLAVLRERLNPVVLKSFLSGKSSLRLANQLFDEVSRSADRHHHRKVGNHRVRYT
jgi:hypothetical protein